MNLWECQHQGCTKTAVGCGAAYGLRAIGWYFVAGGQPGAGLYCPAHRPDPIPCVDQLSTENHGKPCSLCAANAEQRRIQLMIEPGLAESLPSFYRVHVPRPGTR